MAAYAAHTGASRRWSRIPGLRAVHYPLVTPLHDSGTSPLTLFLICLANLLSGTASVVAAAMLTISLQSRLIPLMVSFSTGMMLGTAVLNLVPEAFESGAPLHLLSWVMLAGFVGFFLLEKSFLMRHSHHHEGDGHAHHDGHDKREAGPGGVLVLIGDSFHNFTDGVLIAAAFIADPVLGWSTAVAVALHEIPQEIGDYIVLVNAGLSRRRALLYNVVSSLASVVGGVAAWWFLSSTQALVPLVIALAASGLIYIALADLVPGLHRQRGRRESALQVLLLAAGISVAALSSMLAHGH